MAMKRDLVLLLTLSVLIALSGVANAGLVVIGIASYDSDGNGHSENYKLIYENDSIYGGLVWLDYTRDNEVWQNQIDWVSGLGANLAVTLDPGYTTTIDWRIGWRLPATDESKANLGGGHGFEGPDQDGYHDYEHGYNMVNSEMGHLFHKSLGNRGYCATDGTCPQPGYGLQNTAPFNNLEASPSYWSGTEYSLDTVDAWIILFSNGYQGHGDKGYGVYSLAVRPAEVSGPGIPSTVPLPGAAWLLGSGLIGLLGIRRRFK
jgi:hypothetical protein